MHDLDFEVVPEARLERGRDDGGFDFERFKEIAGLLLRAPRRRPWLSALVFLLTSTLGAGVLAFWPRSYGGSARILAQQDVVLPALDNPTRQVPRETDSPTRNASDSILRRDNVVALVKQLDLVDRWAATRPPILRLKDRVSLAIFGRQTERDRLLDLIGLVEKRLVVASDESSINISIDWPDRQMAYEIVSLVLNRFLEARYDTNVAVITEAIRILDVRAKPQSDEVDAALGQLSTLEAARRSAFASSIMAGNRPGRARLIASREAASVASRDAVDYTLQLEEVRGRTREVREEHRRRVAEAQNQLFDAHATLGPLHPTVLALNAKIASLDTPSPEVVDLQARERELLAKVTSAGTTSISASAIHTSRRPRASASLDANDSTPNRREVGEAEDPGSRANLRDDPSTAMARSRLQVASAKYNELLSRIDSANIELDVTRASFKYQYTVVRPPELARAPSGPSAHSVVLATLIAALVLMMLVPGGLDLMRGRFVEAWQLERELGLPTLGELAAPMAKGEEGRALRRRS
jgi:uncharacterized protein involved in exopolysaccharide biosynthesis